MKQLTMCFPSCTPPLPPLALPPPLPPAPPAAAAAVLALPAPPPIRQRLLRVLGSCPRPGFGKFHELKYEPSCLGGIGTRRHAESIEMRCWRGPQQAGASCKPATPSSTQGERRYGSRVCREAEITLRILGFWHLPPNASDPVCVLFAEGLGSDRPPPPPLLGRQANICWAGVASVVTCAGVQCGTAME